MKEYIERDVVLKHLDECRGTPPEMCYSYPIFTALKCFVEDVPAGDVVEVRHGKNLSEDDPSRFECSECGWRCWDTYCGDTIAYSFCPNCGADMRERDKV